MTKEKEAKEDENQLVSLLEQIRKELAEIKEKLEKQLVDKKTE